MTTTTTKGELDAALASIGKSETAKPPQAPAPALVTLEYEFHPIADLFPLMQDKEFDELAKEHRRARSASAHRDLRGQILDGRNRYRAGKQAGRVLTRADVRYLPADTNPRAYVISANILRRHLTAEQKRGLLADLIKADPTKSNRQIAETANVSHVTVGTVRTELEATGQIDQLETTTGADGKKRKRKGGKGGGGRKGGGGKKETITYAQVTDAKTAINAYSVLEENLLDALQDLNEFSSFAHADECAQATIEKLQEKLGQMQPKEEQEENAEAA
jgi:hypothetical protein